MKKILFTLTILTALLLASSCRSDWDNSFNSGGAADAGGFLLKLNVSNSSINARMTIPSEPGENDINVLHLLFFKGTGAQTFVDAVKIEGEDGRPLDLNVPLQVWFRNTPTLNNNTHYKILAVANIDAYISMMSVDAWIDSFNGTDFHTAISKQLDLGGFTASNQITSNRLLMTATTEKPADREEVSMSLVRAVVRLDVEMTPRLSADYTLVSASVWNVPQKTSIWDSANNNYTNIISDRIIQQADNISDNAVKGQLYTFENKQTQVSQSDRHTTAVILGIEHKGETSYHRINVNLPFAGQDLTRNTVHNITVNHVLGEGAKDEAGAYNSNNSLLQVTINNTDMDSRGVILIDGGNVLVIPTNRIVFSPEGGSREFTIFTYSPDGSARLGVSAITMDTGLSAILTGNSLTVSATSGIDERRGFIELVFGNIRARIEVIQESSFVEFLELNLNMNDIAAFPNGALNTDFPIPMTTPGDLPNFVQVTASSDWVATMYNDEYFGFLGTGDRMIFGDPANNNNTFRVQALKNNEEMNTRFGFVIVSLVSNPNINRVLVLRQEGTDIVSVFAYDDPTEVLTDAKTYFTARGAVIPNAGSGTNRFRITHSEAGLLPGDAGIYFTSGGTIFKVETEPGASNTETILTVTPIADYNSSLNTRHSGRIGLRSPQGGFAAINLDQGFFTFSISPTTERVIPRGGGNSGQITVTATETSGPAANPITASVNWGAVLTNANSGIWYDATSYVWDNTSGTPTINNTAGVNQDAFTVTYPDGNGGNTVVRRVGNLLRAFDGVRPTPGVGGTLSNDLGPFTNNHTAIAGTGETANRNTARVISNPAGVATTVGVADLSAIHNFLFRDGPFTDGVDISPDVALHTDDRRHGWLMGYSTTFIPMIRCPHTNGRVVFGICPKYNLIYVGDPQLFGIHNNTNWIGANLQFIQNLAAWITLSSQYGLEFQDYVNVLYNARMNP